MILLLCSCGDATVNQNDDSKIDAGDISDKIQNTDVPNHDWDDEPTDEPIDEEVVLHAYTMGENYTFACNISSKGYTVLKPAKGGWVVADINGNIVYDEFRSHKLGYNYNISIFDNIVIYKQSNGTTLFINVENGIIFEVPESASCSTISEGRFFIKETEENLDGSQHYITCYDTSFNELFKIEAVDVSVYKQDHAFILDEDKKLWIIDKDGKKIDWNFSVIEESYYFYELYSWYKDPVLEYIEGIYVGDIDFNFQDFGTGMVTTDIALEYAFRASPDSEIEFDRESIRNAILWADGYVGWFDSEVGDDFIANQQVVAINDYDKALIYKYNAEDYIHVKDIPEFSSAAEWHIGKHSENAMCVVLESINGVAFSAIIDADGNVLCQPTKDIVFFSGGSYNHYSGLDERCYFSEGLCPAFSVEKSAWGYIDKSGNWIIEPLYQYISPFNNGYATVVLSEFEPGDYYHLIIDKNGDNAWGDPK